MINFWLLGDYTLLILLLISGLYFIKTFLRFIHSLAMQISYYVVAMELDTNMRAAQQAEFLAEHVKIRESSVKHILYSTIAGAVIIFLRHVLEVVHAYV